MKYLNNIIEQDHRFIKKLMRPTLGFKAFHSAAAALAEIEVDHMIRIDFPVFSDGRGFSLARQLRLLGYTGRLRAKGHVLADQYAMARRTGFDEIEIDQDLARRQPEAQWRERADWRTRDYQNPLQQSA